jgi:hypothetical protein
MFWSTKGFSGVEDVLMKVYWRIFLGPHPLRSIEMIAALQRMITRMQHHTRITCPWTGAPTYGDSDERGKGSDFVLWDWGPHTWVSGIITIEVFHEGDADIVPHILPTKASRLR